MLLFHLFFNCSFNETVQKKIIFQILMFNASSTAEPEQTSNCRKVLWLVRTNKVLNLFIKKFQKSKITFSTNACQNSSIGFRVAKEQFMQQVKKLWQTIFNFFYESHASFFINKGINSVTFLHFYSTITQCMKSQLVLASSLSLWK